VLLLLACAGGEPASEPAPVPDLPVSTCAEPYEWLPTTDMGEILDWEEVPEWSLDQAAIQSLVGLAGFEDEAVIIGGAKVWRIRYRTQGRGQPFEATAILALPDPAPADPVNVLYLHPTTGMEDFCAPSGRDVTWGAVPIAFAGMGYAVAAPDYLGQNGFGAEADFRHPYLGAEPTAIASLDALRALWRFDEVEVPSRKTLIVGASQGGAGGLWAERYATEYLPEAELVGEVLPVPPFDLVGWAEGGAAELSVASIGVPFALSTLSDWYGLDADLGDVVQADQLARIDETMDTECPRAEVPKDLTSVEQIYTDEWRTALATGDLSAWKPWSCLLADSSVGLAPIERTQDVPTFVILGGADDVTLDDVQEAAVTELCDEGQPIVAWSCDGLGHSDAVAATLEDQVAWMAARVAGEDVGATCTGIERRTCE
jgi:triacylglycerol lipase